MTTTPIPTGPTSTGGAGPSKLLIALIAVGGVLLLAVVAIVFLLIGQNSNNGNPVTVGDSTPTPTISETPATPTAEPEDEGDGDGGDGGEVPVDNSTRFTSFNFDETVECDPTGQAEEKAQPSISWASANAASVWWTPSDEDAYDDQGYQIPKSGDQHDMSDSKGPGERFEFPCNHDETMDVTITLVSPSGQHVSKTVTFRDVNWN
jgi:hypothetical protein